PFMAGCQGGGSSASGDKIVIGGIGPLTGDAASYGTSVKNGCQIAIDEINAAGGVNGKQMELLFEDDVCDEEKAISAYNKLMDSGINVLIGAVTSGCSIAVSEVSSADNILQITPSGSAMDCTKHPNSFRICFTDPLQGELMAQYIADKGYKNPAIIYDVASDYSKGIHDAFVAKAAEVGLTIAADESFTGGDVDFKTQLTKIKSSDADCLFLPIYYTEVGYISEQAPTVGVELPYFGCDGWDGVIKQLNGNTANIEGATFLTPFVATSTNEKVQSFVKAYEAAYGATPDQFAADGYDAVYAVKAAVEATNGDISGDALISAMTQIKVEGITGDMSFTAEGEPNKSAMVAVISNGQYTAE
ncbi:MAG: ABC transporter substrate-binding protein, partial [Oscillospiraceae bacterium]